MRYPGSWRCGVPVVGQQRYVPLSRFGGRGGVELSHMDGDNDDPWHGLATRLFALTSSSMPLAEAWNKFGIGYYRPLVANG